MSFFYINTVTHEVHKEDCFDDLFKIFTLTLLYFGYTKS